MKDVVPTLDTENPSTVQEATQHEIKAALRARTETLPSFLIFEKLDTERKIRAGYIMELNRFLCIQTKWIPAGIVPVVTDEHHVRRRG